MSLVEEIFHVTSKMPEPENDFLSQEMRERSMIVVSNIKEAYLHLGSDKALACFDNAIGSAAALECQLLLTETLDLVPSAHLIEPKQLIEKVQRLLSGLYEAFA